MPSSQIESIGDIMARGAVAVMAVRNRDAQVLFEGSDEHRKIQAEALAFSRNIGDADVTVRLDEGVHVAVFHQLDVTIVVTYVPDTAITKSLGRMCRRVALQLQRSWSRSAETYVTEASVTKEGP